MNYGATTKAGATGAAGTLAYTGAEIWIWIAVASAIIITGLVMSYRARRRQHEEAMILD